MPYTELAWAAGFFDGEGCAHIAWTTVSKRTGKTLAYPQVSISQSGESGKEILERFNDAVGGIGRLYGPWKPAKNQKQIRFQLEFSGIAKTEAVYNKLSPYLCNPKHLQFLKTIDAYYTSRS